MKTKTILPVVSLALIAVLTGSLVYEIAMRQRAAKANEQFIIALGTRLYEGLADGDVETAKSRLRALVTAQSLHYEQRYGQETQSKFAPVLAQAREIRAEYEEMNK